MLLLLRTRDLNPGGIALPRKYIVLMSLVFLSSVVPSSARAWEYMASSLELAYQYFSYDHKEDLQEPLRNKEEGNIPGIAILYSYRWPEETYYELRGEISKGTTEYNGSLQNGDPWNDRTDNKFYRFSLGIGHTLWPWEKITVTPYLGIGTVMWERVLGKHTESPYTEKYYYNYFPVGILIVVEPTPWFSLSARAAYHVMMGAQIKLDGNVVSKKNSDLGNRHETIVETPVTIRFSKDMSLVITPFTYYRKFGRGDSFEVSCGSVTSTVYEPASSATISGIRAGIAYIW